MLPSLLLSSWLPSHTVHPNLNGPWILASTLAIWFIVLYTPIFWFQRQLPTHDITLAAHIVCAGTMYLSCAHNCLVTPSCINVCTGQPSKTIHIWVGRIAMITGIISFILGVYVTWSRLNLPKELGGTDLRFGIPMTIGGIFQLVLQYHGYYAIRLYQSLGREIEYKVQHQQHMNADAVVSVTIQQQQQQYSELYELKLLQRNALQKHIGCMICLFVGACGIPASVRLADIITGGHGKDIISIIIILFLIGVITVWYINIMTPKDPIHNNLAYTNIE